MKILHISDIHFEPPKDRGDRAPIQKALLASASALEFDVVVLSGDLATNGDEPEYDVAAAFLQELAQDRPVLIVPGNHDVDRSKADKKALLNANPSAEHFELNRDDVLKPHRFANFHAFSGSFAFQWDANRMTSLSTSLLGFAFVGINTALLSCRKEDSGYLAIDLKDLDDRLGKLANDVPIIAIGHHPLDELAPWNRIEARTLLSRGMSGAHLYLCGHRHLAKGEAQYSSSGAGLAVYQCGAAYQTSRWENNFSVLEVNINRRCLRPRLLTYSTENGTFDDSPAQSHEIPVPWPSTESKSAGTPLTASSPPSAPEPPPAEVENLVKKLEGVFDLVWESERADRKFGCIFWPVRLRRPTLIHAAQAAIAASFQVRGVSVILCLDDFGNAEAEPAFFLSRMHKHFSYVGADWNQVEVLQARDVVSEERLRRTWELLAAWLIREPKLESVLSICKLLVQQARDAGHLTRVLGQKPRKLMTPAVVWSCLDHVLTRTEKPIPPGSSLATLGGHDERGFWQAWQAAFGHSYGKVGHLYGSELNKISSEAKHEVETENPLAMAEPDIEEELSWRSMEDIRHTLAQDAGSVSDPRRIVGWLICQCLVLPSWLGGKEIEVCGKPLRTPADLVLLATESRDDVVRDVATRAAEVLLA